MVESARETGERVHVQLTHLSELKPEHKLTVREMGIQKQLTTSVALSVSNVQKQVKLYLEREKKALVAKQKEKRPNATECVCACVWFVDWC